MLLCFQLQRLSFLMRGCFYLLVSQDHHGQLRLHPQQAVQLGFSQWQAAPVGGVHHVHQNVSPFQVVGPVPPQVLPSPNCNEMFKK